ncbi:MAG: hypothetical protein ABIN96_16855 [Rubrivivax sp.]
MPRKEPEMASATAIAGSRLPSFGAEAAVGPPSRAYRSLVSFGTTGAAAVSPSYQDDEGDTDDAGDVDDVGDSDDGGDSDGDTNDGDSDGGDGDGADSQSDT